MKHEPTTRDHPWRAGVSGKGAGVVLMLWALLVPGRAAAQSPSRAGAKPPPAAPPRVGSGPRTVVFVAPKNAAVQARAVARVIRAQLRDMRVTFALVWVDRMAPQMDQQLVVIKRVAAARQALVVVWCDFANGAKLHLYYVLPGRNRVLVRTVDQGATAQGRIETMGAIVRGGVEAMLSLRRSPRPRVARPVVSPPPASPPPPSPARMVTGGLALAYGLGGYATQGPRVTHSGQLSLQLRFWRRWSLHLSYTAAPGIHAQSDSGDAEVTLHRHGIRLGGGHQWRWRKLFLSVGGSFVLDLLDRRHRASGTLGAQEAALDVNLGLEAMVRVGYRLTTWLSVVTSVGATFMLRNRDYGVHGAADPVLQPWSVQPLWLVGMEVAVF